MINYWGLVIKTNKYAGNLERDLCAHCTGQIGECGVGGDYITDENKELFNNENLNDEFVNCVHDYIINISDEDGCRRPCSIWNLEGDSGYNSVIIYFEDKPSQNAINIIKERSKTFISVVKEKDNYLSSKMEDFEILGFKLVKSETSEEEIEV